MKKSFFYFLPFFLLVMGGFVACEEVEEAGKYDNWQTRNEAFIDSLAQKVKATDKYVATEAEIQALEEGELFAIRDVYASTNKNPQYIYCKKIKKLDSYENARRPLYTESVTAYYYGTLITGDKFNGNFNGYSATDQGFLDKDDADKAPTDFDSPAEFSLSGVVSGWTTVLTYMYVGERWMVYIPWRSGYGSSGKDSVLGYSALAFDMQLESVVDED